MAMIALARHAMGCRFEMVLHGSDAARLRAAGEEALEEIDRIEAQLSLYRSTSEIAHVNARAGVEPVRVSAPVFELLLRARQLSLDTGGAFDITMGPLIRAWGFMGGTPAQPGPDELVAALADTGCRHLALDPENLTVRFDRPSMMVDLGAIGKGYAVEQAVEIIREAGIESGFLHAGTSTVYALGAPPDQPGWKIGIEDPGDPGAAADADSEGRPVMHRLKCAAAGGPEAASKAPPLVELELRDTALSVSSPSGKYFKAGGEVLGHVIDPRTGRPANAVATAAVAVPSATESDALSTALLVLGAEGKSLLEAIRPGAWVFTR